MAMAGMVMRYLPARTVSSMSSYGSVALADCSGRETEAVTSSGCSSVFAGFRFPREVIAVALVPAVRAIVPGRGRAAGRARRHP